MAIEQLTFTDCAKGAGVDPYQTGYQVRACSPGVADVERTALYEICVGHGRAFSRSFAPRAAIQRLDAWQRTSKGQEPLPTDVLEEFPVIWSYDALPGGRYALTHACFTGWTGDGRMGNFFAHALIFHPEKLEKIGVAALALARTNLFLTSDPGGTNRLEALPDFEPVAGEPDLSPLNASPCAEHLEELIIALTKPAGTRRPVVLCLSDWRASRPLVEALLATLPVTIASRLAFSTYQAERARPTKAGTPNGEPAVPHRLEVLCNANGQPFDLRTDDYQTRAVVFNFADNRFSPGTQGDPYASYIAAHVRDGRCDAVRALQRTIDDFGFAEERDVWERMIPIADLGDGPLDAAGLGTVVRIVGDVATTPDLAGRALRGVSRYLRAAAAADNVATIEKVVPGIAGLADHLDPGLVEPPRAFTEMRAVIIRCLREERVRTALALLACFGRAREQETLAVLDELLATDEPRLPADSTEIAPLLDFLESGLTSTGGTPIPNARWEKILLCLLALASSSGHLDQLWQRLHLDVIKPYVDGLDDRSQMELLGRMDDAFPREASADAYVWVRVRWLRVAQGSPQEFADRLVDVARFLPRCRQKEPAANQITHQIQSLFPDRMGRLQQFGRLAQVARDLPVNFFAIQWRSSLEGMGALDATEIRKDLIEGQAPEAVCEEIFEHVFRNGTVNHEKLEHWIQILIGKSSALHEAFCENVGRHLARVPSPERLLPLAERLLAMADPERAGTAPEIEQLYRAIFDRLPRSDPRLQKLCAQLPEPLAERLNGPGSTGRILLEIAARVREGVFHLADLANAATSPGKEWDALVAQLPMAEHGSVRNEWLRTIEPVGIVTTADADAFVRVLSNLDATTSENIAKSVATLLRERDIVTTVLTATAFADLARPSDPEGRIERIFRAIVQGLPPTTRQLLRDHLRKRFGIRPPEDESNVLSWLQTAPNQGDIQMQAMKVATPAASASPTKESEPRKELKSRGIFGIFGGGKESDAETRQPRRE